jgi:hypothetical protein
MERYAAWLARLPEEQRKKIEQAPDTKARLELIRRLREEQWVATLPKAHRERMAKLQGAERHKLVAKLRREEQTWRAKWQFAFNHWLELTKKKPLPASLEDYRKGDKKEQEVATFIKEYLLPRLSPEEQDRLKSAEGKWPLYPGMLVEFADRHPMALRGKHGPTSIKQLPGAVTKLLRVEKSQKGYDEFNAKKLRAYQKKPWPALAVGVTQLLDFYPNLSLPYELWPRRTKDLSPMMQGFVAEKLRPVLDNNEKQMLEIAEGRWPDFPETIQKLADKRGLDVPWQTLPGRRSDWDAYRVKNYQLVEGW